MKKITFFLLFISASYNYAQGSYVVHDAANGLHPNTTVTGMMIDNGNQELDIQIPGMNSHVNFTAPVDISMYPSLFLDAKGNNQAFPIKLFDANGNSHSQNIVLSFAYATRELDLTLYGATIDLTQVTKIKFGNNSFSPTSFKNISFSDPNYWTDQIAYWSSPGNSSHFEDFESGGIITWGGQGIPFEIIDNPFPSEGNTSDKVFKYDDGGNDTWANVNFAVDGTFDLSQNAAFTLKLYIPSDSITPDPSNSFPGDDQNQITLKLQNFCAADAAHITQSEITLNYVTDQWQELVFDFSDYNLETGFDGTTVFDKVVNWGGEANTSDKTTLNRVMMQINGENNLSMVKAYVDDFLYHGSVPLGPVCQPDPPIVMGGTDAGNLHDDFEGNGTISSWASDPGHGVVIDLNHSNPFPGGINTSATVLQYIDDGGVYANIRLQADNDFDLISHHTFTLKVYVDSNTITGDSPNQMALKLQNGNSSAPWEGQWEIAHPIELDVWQELEFKFETLFPTGYNRVVFQVNSEGNTNEVTAYFDDLHYDGTPTDPDPEDPTVRADDPSHTWTNSWDIITSIWSDAFWNVPTSWENIGWTDAGSTSQIEDMAIKISNENSDGDRVKKFTEFNWTGIEPGSPIEAEANTHINLDIYSRSASFELYLRDYGTNNQWSDFGDPSSDDTQGSYIIEGVVADQWNSYSIPLDHFPKMTNRSAVGLLTLYNLDTASTKKVYLDNIYFSNESNYVAAATTAVPTTSATVPVAPDSDIISLFSDVYTDEAAAWNNPSWGMASTLDTLIVNGDTIHQYDFMNLTGIEPETPLDLTNYQNFIMHYWSSADNFTVKLVDYGVDGEYGGEDDAEGEITFTPVANQWNTINEPLSSFTGLTSNTKIGQVVFSQNDPTKPTVYVDNVYFAANSLSVAEVNTKNTHVTPNPTSGLINVTGDVYSVSGQKVLNNTNDLSGLPNGIYFVRVNGITSKIIKK